MRSLLFFAVFALSLIACRPQQKEGASSAATPPPTPAFPALPMEILRTLVAECDYIDLIVYNPSFSMSQGDAPSVLGTIQQISESVPAHNPANPAFGHIFYQAKGQTILDADVYLGPSGNYFVFYQDSKPAFANVMTQQGANFYANILNRLQGAPQ